MSYFCSLKKANEWFDKQHWLLQLVLMLSIVFIVRTFIFGFYIVPTGSMEPTMLVGESFYSNKLPFMLKKIRRGEIISINDPTFSYSENYLMYLFQFYVWGPDNWTKRVIGIPGDHVEGKIINGKPVVFLNGEKLDEPYINPYPLVSINEESTQLHLSWPPFKTEENHRVRTFDPSFDITSPQQPFYIIKEESILPNKENPKIYYPFAPNYDGGVSDVFDVTLEDGEYWLMGDNRRGSFDSRGFGKINKNIIHGKIVFRIFSIDTSNSLLYEVFTNPIVFFTKKIRPWSRWFSRFNKDYLEVINSKNLEKNEAVVAV